MEIDKILAQRRINYENEPSNHERYRRQLLAAFPPDIPSGDLFHPNTFVGDDAIDYSNCMNLFMHKKWPDIDFDELYHKYIQFCYLTELGDAYYLPAFLSYFYELRHLDLEYFTYFLTILERGRNAFERPYDRHTGKMLELKYDYTGFECLTIEQAKLVASFLVNIVNLLPANYHEVPQAQRALTNYWGNFLLF